ncbi:MAG TPA: Coq4 family protein, partial [Nostoc sp.]|uniref:Coq4 family protein n=1 Tax=Nostoc sp. TaxID=1180 RepID=UPI002D7020F1
MLLKNGWLRCLWRKAFSLSVQFSRFGTVMPSTPQGKQAFERRSRLGDIDLQKLYRLPPNTFGYAYAEHLLKNNLQP